MLHESAICQTDFFSFTLLEEFYWSTALFKISQRCLSQGLDFSHFFFRNSEFLAVCFGFLSCWNMPILSRLCRLRVISSSLMQSYIITLLLLTVVVLARFTQIYWSHLTKEWAPTIHQADGKFNLAVLCQRASKDFFFLDTVHRSWCYATSLKLSSLKHFWETVASIIDCVLVYLLITAAGTFRMIYR